MADLGEVFAKIVSGEIPSHKVYEDERVLAFLDINPLSPGHTLIIPKRRSNTLDAMSDEDAVAIGRVLPRVARAVIAATGGRDFNLLQNNGAAAHQEVPWVHFHIIPKPPGSGASQGLGIGWPATKLDHAEGAKLAGAIREKLAADGRG